MRDKNEQGSLAARHIAERAGGFVDNAVSEVLGYSLSLDERCEVTREIERIVKAAMIAAANGE